MHNHMNEFHKHNDGKKSQTQRVHTISFILKFKDKQKGSMTTELRIVIPLDGVRVGIDWKEVQESVIGHQNVLCLFFVLFCLNSLSRKCNFFYLILFF